VNSQPKNAARMPLHYALDALDACISEKLPDESAAQALHELFDYLWEMEKGKKPSRIRKRLSIWKKRFAGKYADWPATGQNGGC
jgi:hypothetical protein